MSLRLISVASVVVLLSSIPLALEAQTREPIDFLGVVPPKDDDYRKADSALKDYLVKALRTTRPGVTMDYKKFDSYGEEIRNVTDRREGAYLARMTPYAYVTAWMLGADFDVLATYESKATGNTTYHSYFVVNRRSFGEGERNLDTLRDYVKRLSNTKRPVFIYHDQFSTSSYFLPALWLRRQLIFDMPASIGGLTAIEARYNTEGSSTDSVQAVARGEADLAAVWDGTKQKFAASPDVWFIPLPDPLPNDLLVCTNRLNPDTKKAVTDAIAAMKKNAINIGIGDFTSWTQIQDALDARQALANLRQLATAPPAPVVVDIDAPSEELKDALRKAVRLSYPEFVLFDSDFHETWDMKWTLQVIHKDEAVELITEMNGTGVKDLTQRFPVSYLNVQGDLTTRIMALIHTRMHRVRYVWPYQELAPTILGDVDFTVAKGTQVRVERIMWTDPQRNDFTRGGSFLGTIVDADFYKFQLKRDEFQAAAQGKLDFHSPLSNVAYRAILERPTYETTTSKVGTAALLVLLIAAAAGAAFDLRRKRSSPPDQTERIPSLDQECLALARGTHAPWLRPLNDADMLWCDRPKIEEKIEELKTRHLVSIAAFGTQGYGTKWAIAAKLPFVNGFITPSAEMSSYRNLVIDPAKVGDTVRLGALLRLLIDQSLLSTFVGRPIEWDALNGLVSRAIGGNGGAARDAALKPGDEVIVARASEHFGQVIEDGLQNPSLFPATWSVSVRDEHIVASAVVTLPAELEVGREKERIRTLSLEFGVPPEALSRASNSGQLRCWLLGTILKVSVVEANGGPSLRMRFGPLAVLTEDAAGFDV